MEKIYNVGMNKTVSIFTDDKRKGYTRIQLFEHEKMVFAIATKDANEAIDKVDYLTWLLQKPFSEWEIIAGKELQNV